MEEHILQALLSYVPRSLISMYIKNPAPPKEPQITNFKAAVMFVDISGFTQLTEQMTQMGNAGVEEIAKHISKYFGQVIDRIHSYNGDVLKFAVKIKLYLKYLT